MEKEALKLLIQALKAKQEPQIPVASDPQGIPDLPNLSGEQLPQLPSAPGPQPSEDSGLSLDTHGLNYRSDLANILLNQKGIGIESDNLKGKLGYNGDFNLDAKAKLFGGNLGIGLGRNQGNRNFSLQFEKPF